VILKWVIQYGYNWLEIMKYGLVEDFSWSFVSVSFLVSVIAASPEDLLKMKSYSSKTAWVMD